MDVFHDPHKRAKGSEFEMRELWCRYREDDPAARERLILSYAPLVKFAAGRLRTRLPSHVDEGDLISSGLMGLLGAIERFVPERGVKFETYALFRIRGAMLDALRALDWVPRKVRLNARESELVETRLRTELGRTPNEAELAGGLGVTVKVLRQRLLEIANSRIYSFDAPLSAGRLDSSDGDADLHDFVSSHGFADPQEALDVSDDEDSLKSILAPAVADLPEREQFVLTCRYREDLRLREIAEVMGMSESRVSQLLTKALISLRAAIGASRESNSAAVDLVAA